MRSYIFHEWINQSENETPFDRLFNIFRELLTYTSGDVAEAIDWMNQLDREYQLTDNEYGMGNFIEDLKNKGYLRETEAGEVFMGAKMEQSIRQNSLNEIFGKLKKSGKGEHHSPHSGSGGDLLPEQRPFVFGDAAEHIALTDSLKNAQIRNGDMGFQLTENDLLVNETEHRSQSSTVLMIDISHSMILYGEDRITPAKKVAMALAELIRTRYPKDTLDIIVFGNDAWQIDLKDLPYLQVGPFHTNTVAGLRLAQEILRKRKNPNKQIFMITDGKPSCLKEGAGYYQNSFGLDRKIVNKTLNEAAVCKKLGIPITTFMIAKDPYLQQFIEEFTEVNSGQAFYTNLQGLGEYVFHDYARNKRKRLK